MSVSSQRVRPIDVMHLGKEHVICCWEVYGWLVDPGPQSCEETLLAALGNERPRGLLLTHIHFDHAGAAGSLVRRWADPPVYVHERGAPHCRSPPARAPPPPGPSRPSSSPRPPASTAARKASRGCGARSCPSPRR